MFRTMLISFALVLSHVLSAQAALPGMVNEVARAWKTTHAGETQIAGVDIIAALERSARDIQVPDLIANKLRTLVPLESVEDSRVRIVLIDRNNPEIRTPYLLSQNVANIDGQPRTVFSSLENQADFQFLLVAQADGSQQVAYKHFLADGSVEEGQLLLLPLPQIF